MRVCLLVLMLAVTRSLGAQLRGEAAIDYVRAAHERVEVSIGAAGRLGNYLRPTLRFSADVWNGADTSAVLRAEYVVRFMLDPLGQTAWGLSVGAGLGYRARPYLALVADLEAGRNPRFRPALQVTLGGGTRLGVVIRRSTRGLR